MVLFGTTLGYVSAHLLLFRFVLRGRLRLLESERGIFLFHTISFLAANLTVLAVGIFCRPDHWSSWLVFTIGTHGIYSLSFLELWSLTQGSYSLSLLARIDSLAGDATLARLQDSAEIGRKKSTARGLELAKLGLVRQMPGSSYRLTFIGTVVATVLCLFLRLTNGRSLNR